MLPFFCQMGDLRWGNPNPNTDSYTVPVPGYGSIWTCTQTSQKLPNLNYILLHQFFFFYPLLEISKICMPKVFLKFEESKPRGLTVRGLRVRGRMVQVAGYELSGYEVSGHRPNVNCLFMQISYGQNLAIRLIEYFPGHFSSELALPEANFGLAHK